METNVQWDVAGAAGVSGFLVLTFLWGLFVTLFWMICGWRAMRAHERIARSVEQMAKSNTQQPRMIAHMNPSDSSPVVPATSENPNAADPSEA